ncbi:16S rRNA (guanine(527)-N(7))-methyltransferase RsmG [Arcanobacterium haemolyticum]|nr:16S rRNA (guanine(527)-N(7))-methyltransferase RsmG [Arcanobacterium haemolyticum]
MVEVEPAGGAEHFGDQQWSLLTDFAGMLVDEGEKRGLVGPRELDRLWTRHILNSTAISGFVPEGARVADVGSGAGFPGLVLAMIRPDTKLILIDSMERRCQWLRDVCSELNIGNVEVKLGRSEEFFRQVQVDIVTARAVAALKKLLGWTMPLLKPGGSLVALKGIKVDDEIDAAIPELRKYRAQWADVHVVTPFGCDEATRVLEVRKKK